MLVFCLLGEVVTVGMRKVDSRCRGRMEYWDASIRTRSDVLHLCGREVKRKKRPSMKC